MKKLLVVIVVATSLWACPGPKEGDSCSTSQALCDGAFSALFCRANQFDAVPCKGPLGCRESGNQVSCDTTGNVAGDSCAPSQEAAAQCDPQNANRYLLCQGGVFVAQSCPGIGQTCGMDSQSVFCE